MSSRLFPWFFVVAGLLLFVAFSLFSVSETEYAIRTRFGAIIDTRYRPGLHLKWPWDRVTKFDRRILSESYTGETFLTNDGRGLIVDFYVKWRVKDPATYFNAAAGSEALAGQRLAEIVKDGIKSVVAQRTLQQSSRPSAPQSPTRCSARRAATPKVSGSISSMCACSVSISPTRLPRASTRA